MKPLFTIAKATNVKNSVVTKLTHIATGKNCFIVNLKNGKALLIVEHLTEKGVDSTSVEVSTKMPFVEVCQKLANLAEI